MQPQKCLPIEQYKKRIMACRAPYFIVEAETGSGKTTCIPQWFYERGASVLVTEPLIETTIGAAEHVARLMRCKLGTTVGYASGFEKEYSRETRILFCTDGLALVRELVGWRRFSILLLDELHEWNVNQSTLEAWAYDQLLQGTLPFKQVVALSATMDTEALAKARGNAPLFRVPGRQYPIEDRPKGMSIEADIRALVAEGHDALVFQPGKEEIAQTIKKLNGIPAHVFPFHAQLTRVEKRLAYANYTNRPKVVISTNALETGRTLLPSKGRRLAVVDSGMERRTELTEEGIEALILSPIAQSSSTQRRGRTGRVGEGIYIDHCPVEKAKRPRYPIPEILRTRIDQTVLRLAVAGYDAARLPFFHKVDTTVIARARKTLSLLGALANEGQSVTAIGNLMARLPLSAEYARMIVEAEKFEVVGDVLTIASILEVGSIRDRMSAAWQEFARDTESDLLVELSLWVLAEGGDDADLKDMGIVPAAFRRAEKIRCKIYNTLHAIGFTLDTLDGSGDRVAVMRACAAGMVEHLYRKGNGSREYVSRYGEKRWLSKQSVIYGEPDWIVGVPWDVGVKGGGIHYTRRYITMASLFDPSWLIELAPELVS